MGAYKRVLPRVLRDNGRKFDVSGFHVECEAPIGGVSFNSGGRFLRGGVSESRHRPSNRLDAETVLENFIETISHPGRRGGRGDRVQLRRCIDR